MVEPRADVLAPTVSDGLVAAGQAAVVALVIALGSLDGGAPDAGAYAFAAAFGLVLLVRRRLPVAVLALTVLGVFAYYALDYPAIGTALPAVGAVHGAAERARVAVAAAAGAVLIVVSVPFRIDAGASAVTLAGDVITNAALVAAAIGLAVVGRQRRALRVQQVDLLAAVRARELERSARLLEEQRVRLARDLHDSIGHALALVSVQAQVARQSVDRGGHADQAMGHVVDAVGSSLTELRRTLALLRDPGPRPSGDHDSSCGIEATVDAARAAGLVVDLDLAADPAELPADMRDTTFRVVQECLTNTLRHAAAGRVRIGLRWTADGLVLEVADDGTAVGSPVPPVEGSGIAGMRERVRHHGGDLTVRADDHGFVVRAVLPGSGAS